MKYSNWKRVLIDYIKKNNKEYAFIILLFLIGVFIGVLTINYSSEEQISEIIKYINEFIARVKDIERVNNLQLTIHSIKKNLIFATIIWSAGTTIIGIPIVLIFILIRGMILGFTISSITITLGTVKGILFCMLALVLHNLVYIPALLTIGVSSIKLYRTIIKEKGKDSIKIGIIRHMIISTIMIVLLVLSAIIENYITLKILKKIIKYF